MKPPPLRSHKTEEQISISISDRQARKLGNEVDKNYIVTSAELERLQAQLKRDEAVVTRPKIFSEGEYKSRLGALHGAMSARDIKVVLLSSPESQCWLHGYQARWYRTGSSTLWPPVNFTAVRVDDDRMIAFDTMDHEKLFRSTSIVQDYRSPSSEDPTLEDIHKFVLDELVAMGWMSTGDTVGIEKWSPRQNAATTENLVFQIEGRARRVVDVSALVRHLQLIKSKEEIEVIREASQILDSAYRHLTKKLHPDMTEIQVWAELEWAMAQQGGETTGLHNAVSRTRNYCHAFSSTRTIGPGPLLVDPCGVKHRYHANTARQFYLGAPPAEFVKASMVAAFAITVLKDVARPGVTFGEVNARLREYYKECGVWDFRDWLGGYQLGIAFPPDWVGEFNWNVDGDERDKVVQDGLVTNFESFVGGAGCIDTVIFHREGTEVLSKIPQELQIIEI
ncbi:Xaa-Pro dipeptidase [Labrys miyagiensis]